MRGADTARIGGREARISAFGQLFYREKEQSEKFCLYLQPRKDDKRRSRRGRKAGLPRFAAILERCRSGRSGRTRNAVYGQLYRGFESLSLRKRPGGRLGCKHSFATFFIFGVDKFIRSGLKIKVGRMAGRRKSGVRKVASGPTEGRTGGMR